MRLPLNVSSIVSARAAVPSLSVAPGRPFPPLDYMLRVSIGTEADMANFRFVQRPVGQAFSPANSSALLRILPSQDRCPIPKQETECARVPDLPS